MNRVSTSIAKLNVDSSIGFEANPLPVQIFAPEVAGNGVRLLDVISKNVDVDGSRDRVSSFINYTVWFYDHCRSGVLSFIVAASFFFRVRFMPKGLVDEQLHPVCAGEQYLGQ